LKTHFKARLKNQNKTQLTGVGVFQQKRIVAFHLYHFGEAVNSVPEKSDS